MDPLQNEQVPEDDGLREAIDAEESAVEEAGQPPAAAPPLAPDLLQSLRHEGLQPIAGETESAAYARLNRHLVGKNREFRQQFKEMRETAARTAAQVEELHRLEWRRLQARQVEQQAAETPDPAVDPQGYLVWKDMQRDERERFAEEQRLAEEQRAGNAQAVREYTDRVDLALKGELEAILGTPVQGVPGKDWPGRDQAAAEAWEKIYHASLITIQRQFPSATPAQMAEMIQWGVLQQTRPIIARGGDLRSYLLATAAPLSPVPAAPARPGANGRPALVKTPRSPVVATPGGRTAAGAARGPQDISTMSEDDYLKARLSGAITDDELGNALGQARW